MLDFDGSLAAIVARPTDARPVPVGSADVACSGKARFIRTMPPTTRTTMMANRRVLVAKEK